MRHFLTLNDISKDEILDILLKNKGPLNDRRKTTRL